jgi:D-sedoheptulose 7-phosphate isomerase
MSVTNTEFKAFYRAYMQETHDLLDIVREHEIEAAVDMLWAAYKNNKHVYVAGNGGSAATAIHFSCCLSTGLMVPGKRGIKSEALVGNIASMTALANDFNYDLIFTRQLENALDPGDVFVAISCSGNSPNVVSAAEYAKAAGGQVLSFLGFSGGKLRDLSDAVIYVENHNYGQVETIHVSLGHLIAQFLKQRILAE